MGQRIHRLPHRDECAGDRLLKNVALLRSWDLIPCQWPLPHIPRRWPLVELVHYLWKRIKNNLLN